MAVLAGTLHLFMLENRPVIQKNCLSVLKEDLEPNYPVMVHNKGRSVGRSAGQESSAFKSTKPEGRAFQSAQFTPLLSLF